MSSIRLYKILVYFRWLLLMYPNAPTLRLYLLPSTHKIKNKGYPIVYILDNIELVDRDQYPQYKNIPSLVLSGDHEIISTHC